MSAEHLAVQMQTDASEEAWHLRFVDLADLVASWSKDPSTKVGAVAVDPCRNIRAVGFNGFARGVSDDGRLLVRETKYRLIVHAEENVIAAAARMGQV